MVSPYRVRPYIGYLARELLILIWQSLVGGRVVSFPPGNPITRVRLFFRSFLFVTKKGTKEKVAKCVIYSITWPGSGARRLSIVFL